MRSRISFSIILIFIFLISISSMASAREITVADDNGADFESIQEAVDGAEAGDVIIIKPGTYVENINVSKARLTIKPETNYVFIEPTDSTVASIILSNVGTTLSGLNIVGSIHVDNALLGDSEYYKNNNMSQITNNVIENGGISVGSESSGIIISGNRISGGGIDVSCCGDFNEINNNVVSNCLTGIYVYDERDVPPIRDNKISNCDVGIHVSGYSYDLINNQITNCGIGVVAGETGGATLVGNKITCCTECGVEATGYLGTNYNNYFNNTVNIKFGDSEKTDAWNTSLVSGTNIVGGPYIGGNFWAKPDGTGFSQICVDLDGNGIGDLPYNIYEDEFDYLPLVSLSNSVTPTANFTASVTNGTAPLVVKFTDFSKNAIVWNWDFDGNGITDSTKQNPVYVYRIPGNYTVNLTASNGLNTNSKLTNITVEKRDSPTWPFVYITSGLSNLGTVSAIDMATGTVINKVKVGGWPEGVTVTPNGKTTYVTNSWDDNVYVIDTATNTVIATVKVGSSPARVAVTPDGTKVYVTNFYSNDVSVIDIDTNTIIATVSVGNNPSGVAVSPDGTKVYVTNSGDNNISVIKTATNTVTSTVYVGSYPAGLSVTQDGKKVYVANMNSRTVSVVDTATNTVTATVNIDNSPHEIGVNPTGTKVYVAGEYDDVVFVIDTSNNTVIATVNVVGDSPKGLSVTPDGKKVYVASSNTSGNNTLSVIDTSNNTITSTVIIEFSPAGIAIIPEPVYPVANFSTNVTTGNVPLSVQFIDLSENATELYWDFGDGIYSTQQNPAHAYNKTGNYTVSLTAVNNGGKDTKTKSKYIVVSRK
jgi:YVTN family beta-propeller protein/parallel beta-helix repeat protein